MARTILVVCVFFFISLASTEAREIKKLSVSSASAAEETTGIDITYEVSADIDDHRTLGGREIAHTGIKIETTLTVVVSLSFRKADVVVDKDGCVWFPKPNAVVWVSETLSETVTIGDFRTAADVAAVRKRLLDDVRLDVGKTFNFIRPEAEKKLNVLAATNMAAVKPRTYWFYEAQVDIAEVNANLRNVRGTSTSTSTPKSKAK